MNGKLRNMTSLYLVDEKGNPLNNYHGILGKTNQGISAPYQVCNVHTKAQWDAYLTTGEILAGYTDATLVGGAFNTVFPWFGIGGKLYARI